jgi:hypothetical protein
MTDHKVGTRAEWLAARLRIFLLPGSAGSAERDRRDSAAARAAEQAPPGRQGSSPSAEVRKRRFHPSRLVRSPAGGDQPRSASAAAAAGCSWNGRIPRRRTTSLPTAHLPEIAPDVGICGIVGP